MTEAEWLRCSDLPRLIKSQRQPERERKLRLFACACVRGIWNQLTPESARFAVEVAERWADNVAPHDEVEQAYQAASTAWSASRLGMAGLISAGLAVLERDASKAALYASTHTPGVGVPSGTASRKSVMASLNQCNLGLFHDIVGNPFRPVTFAPSWRSETAIALATGIYTERAFDRLPILADALEEAGCDHPDVLAHCRGPGPHARGCWVVDGVLGRQ